MLVHSSALLGVEIAVYIVAESAQDLTAREPAVIALIFHDTTFAFTHRSKQF